MNFIQSIKLKERGRRVRFLGKAYDVIKPELILVDFTPYLLVNGENKKILNGCILGDWEIYEEKLFVLADEINWSKDIKGEGIVAVKHIKTFIQKVKEDIIEMRKKDNDVCICCYHQNKISNIISKRAGDLK